MAAATPPEILSVSLQRAIDAGEQPLISDPAIRERVKFIALNPHNRSGVRAIMACTLATVHNPSLDPRKPYKSIGGKDSFSGRTYDERQLASFFRQNRLPVNSTTAFLTPAFRNRNTVLTPGLNLSGTPPELYEALLQLLDDVYQKRVAAQDVMAETIRLLILKREEENQRLSSYLHSLEITKGQTSLSSEGIVTLVDQHLRFQRTSRLPVLIVAAAYKSAENHLRENVVDLMRHNAADSQTGSLGDIEITLVDDARVVTSYEMKMKLVIKEDIDIAVAKAAETEIDNYIFITTEPIDPLVQEYAKSLYRVTGIEFVILDCISFLRYFLHLFHRLRSQFLEEYQTLLLAEPASAVSQPLKEAFLSMRLAAETAE